MAGDRLPSAGFLRGGLPYNRFGRGPRPLVVVQGLTFENAPLHGISARFAVRIHAFLGDAYTGYIVNRRPGLPRWRQETCLRRVKTRLNKSKRQAHSASTSSLIWREQAVYTSLRKRASRTVL